MDIARAVFGSAFQPEIRRSRYESTIPYSAPVEQADGTVQVLAYERQVYFGGPDRLERCPDAPQRQGWASWSGFGTQDRGPATPSQALTDDGTAFFATRGGVIRGVREGREVLSVPSGGTVCTPLVFDAAGNLVYGLASGHLCVLGRDGRTLQDHALLAPTPASTPTPTSPPPERMSAVLPLADGSFVVKTVQGYRNGYEGRILCVDPAGQVAWSRPCHFAENMEAQPPVPSPDGTVLYLGGIHGRLLALRVADGTEAWGRDLPNAYTPCPPALDPQGNVCALASDGTVYRLGAAGDPVHPPIATNVPFFSVNSTPASLVVDAAGDICVAPDWRHFLVFDPTGHPVVQAAGTDLFFHDGDYIHSVSLSRNREQALVLGSSTLACVSLPPPLARAAEAALQGRGRQDAPTIERAGDFVTINGIRVPVAR